MARGGCFLPAGPVLAASLLLLAALSGCAAPAVAPPPPAPPPRPAADSACAQAIFQSVARNFQLADSPVTDSYTQRRLSVRVRLTIEPDVGATAPQIIQGSGDLQYDTVVLAAVARTLGDRAAQAVIGQICRQRGPVVLRFRA
jgi:hypothetical protein